MHKCVGLAGLNLCNHGDIEIFYYLYNLDLCTTVCNSFPKKATFGEKEVKFVIDKK